MTDDAQNSQQNTNESTVTKNTSLEKPRFKGFLNLIALSMLIGPPAFFMQAIESINLVLQHRSIETFNLFLSRAIIYEAVYSTGIFLLILVSATLFFLRDHGFPKFYSFSLLSILAFQLTEIPIAMTAGVKSDSSPLIRAFVACLIWIPYILLSKNSKSTFTLTGSKVFSIPNQKLVKVIASIAIISSGLTLLAKFPDNSPKSLAAKGTLEKPLDAPEIAKKSLESFVVVESFDKKGKMLGRGSGFLLFSGIVVTNQHVIKGAKRIGLYFHDDQTRYSASEIISEDARSDLALIEVPDMAGSGLDLGDPNDLKIGDQVFVLGNPRGLNGTFSSGIISNKPSVQSVQLLQITAPISPGSSGGPVMNISGKVIGISSSYIERGQNLNFAVPSTYIAKLVAESERFYPIFSNSVVNSNKSVLSVLPNSCTHYADMELPEKYFTKVSPRLMESKEIKELCREAMPNCKSIWSFSNSIKNLVFVGSTKLEPTRIAGISKATMDTEISSVLETTKMAYRKSSPDAKFEFRSFELRDHLFKVDFTSRYTEAIDRRFLYFILPYCRVETLISSSDRNEEFINLMSKILSNSIELDLPGYRTKKSLFSFPAH